MAATCLPGGADTPDQERIFMAAERSRLLAARQTYHWKRNQGDGGRVLIWDLKPDGTWVPIPPLFWGRPRRRAGPRWRERVGVMGRDSQRQGHPFSGLQGLNNAIRALVI